MNVASSLQSGMQTLTDGNNTLLMFSNGGLIDLHGVTAAPTIHWTYSAGPHCLESGGAERPNLCL